MLSFISTIGLLTCLAGTAYSQTIDPSTVPLATRQQWCASQIAQCPLICLQTAGNTETTLANSCDPTTLLYSCICSNGLAPNATEYSQTIPYFECTEYNSQCVLNCGGVSSCQSACTQDNPCGAQNPTRVNVTSTSTSLGSTSTTAPATAAASTSATVVYTGFGSAATTTAASTHSNGAAQMSQIWGFGALVTGISLGLVFLS